MGYAIFLILSRIRLTAFDPNARIQPFRKCRWFRLQLALAPPIFYAVRYEAKKLHRRSLALNSSPRPTDRSK
jgi:hypothetical protein